MDEKDVKGERMFSSGRGVDTESGKDVREAVQLGMEHMKTVDWGWGDGGHGQHPAVGGGDARRCGYPTAWWSIP